jgi:four helix bundle protein
MGESFKELVVWQRSVELSLAVYKLTSGFPPSERFGLTNQLRRAAVSVASNIAEGYGRSTKGEYVLLLGHARGSNFEVQTQLIISARLGFGSEDLHEQARDLSEEVSRMVVAMDEQAAQVISVSLFPVPCSLLPVPCSSIIVKEVEPQSRLFSSRKYKHYFSRSERKHE